MGGGSPWEWVSFSVSVLVIVAGGLAWYVQQRRGQLDFEQRCALYAGMLVFGVFLLTALMTAWLLYASHGRDFLHLYQDRTLSLGQCLDLIAQSDAARVNREAILSRTLPVGNAFIGTLIVLAVTFWYLGAFHIERRLQHLVDAVRQSGPADSWYGVLQGQVASARLLVARFETVNREFASPFAWVVSLGLGAFTFTIASAPAHGLWPTFSYMAGLLAFALVSSTLVGVLGLLALAFLLLHPVNAVLGAARSYTESAANLGRGEVEDEGSIPNLIGDLARAIARRFL